MSEPVASAAPEVQPDLAPDPLRLSDRQRWAIGAVLLLLAFGALGVYPLHEPDEGRYAELAAGMVRSGDWLHPRLSGIDYFEKPPLALWGVAAGLSLLGHSEAGARASTALAFLLTALLVGAWCGRLRAGRGYDPRGALLFAALPLSGFFSRVLLVDTPLTLWTTLCLYGLYRALVEPAFDARVPRRWLACAYAAAGLGMLTKGPIGVVLPVASAGGYLLLTRSWRRLPWLVWPPGVLLFAALSVPWFALMERAHPGYLRTFFLEQNLARATTGGRFGRGGSLLFYVPVLLVGFLPWVALLPRLLRRVRAAGTRPPELEARARLFLLSAVAVPLAILTVAGSKLVYYALPLAPPFAVLALGELRRLAQEAPRPRPRLGVALLVLGGAVAFAGALALLGSLVEPETLQAWVGRQRSPTKLAEELQRLHAVGAALPVVGVAALPVGLGLGWSGRALRAGRQALALSGVAGCLLLANLAAPWVLREAGAAYSDRDLALAVAAHAGEHGAVVGYGTFRRGVPFYLDRPCYVWYATYAEFGHDLARGECRYALQNDEPALAALIAAEPRIVLIARNVKGGEALAALSPVPLRLLTTVGGRALFVRADAR